MVSAFCCARDEANQEKNIYLYTFGYVLLQPSVRELATHQVPGIRRHQFIGQLLLLLWDVSLANTLGVPPAEYPPRTGTRQILEVGLGLATG